jgi:hypothetical protein
MTSKLLPLVKHLLSPPPLFPKGLARLPKKSGNSMPTRHFAITEQRQGLKAYARFVQQRLVIVHFFLTPLGSQPILIFQKEEEEAAKKK